MSLYRHFDVTIGTYCLTSFADSPNDDGLLKNQKWDDNAMESGE
jgi:hypothetical protein